MEDSTHSKGENDGPNSEIVKRKRGDQSEDDNLMNSDSEEEEKTAEQSVFSNNYLLWSIFKCSNFQDLKAFRQVNRLWNLEATKLLLKSPKMKPLQLKNHVFEGEGYGMKMSFSRLYELVSNSLTCPFNSLELQKQRWNIFMMPEANWFFRAHGSIFEKIFVTFGQSAEAEIRTVQMCFGKLFPNLKSLFINSSGSASVSFPPPFPPNSTVVEMRKLKTLKFCQDIEKAVLEKLLQISPNLERICWLTSFHIKTPCSFLKSLVELNAISLLKNASLTFSSESIDTYKHVLEQKPKLNEVDEICFIGPLSPQQLIKAGDILTRLLNSCSQTLTQITNISPLGDVPGLVIPVLPNVTVTTVDFLKCSSSLHPGPTSLLPPANNFSNIFPNLRKFYLVFERDEQLLLDAVFPAPVTPLLSVKTVKIEGNSFIRSMYIPTKWVKQFCEMFPNVTRASFDTLYDADVEHLWKLGCLEELKIAVGVDVGRDSYPKVDSIFTGFSEDTVKQLYSTLSGDSKMSDIDIKALSVKSSIADLKSKFLKHFEFETAHS